MFKLLLHGYFELILFLNAPNSSLCFPTIHRPKSTNKKKLDPVNIEKTEMNERNKKQTPQHK